MKRLYYSDASDTPPSPPKNPITTQYPQDGNKATKKMPTVIGAYWYHMITEEFMAVIEQAGLEPSITNLHQLADVFADFKERASRAEAFKNQAEAAADRAEAAANGVVSETAEKIKQIQDEGSKQVSSITAKGEAVNSDIEAGKASLQTKLEELIAQLDATGGEQANYVKAQAQDILDAIKTSEKNAKTYADNAAASAASASSTISDGKQAISDAKDAAVEAVGNAQKTSVSAVQAAQKTATDAVAAKSSEAQTAIANAQKAVDASVSAASASATAASKSATAAKASETNAASSESNAAASAESASDSANAAQSSSVSAAASKTAASASAATATTQASAAKGFATQAKASADAAAESASGVVTETASKIKEIQDEGSKQVSAVTAAGGSVSGDVEAGIASLQKKLEELVAQLDAEGGTEAAYVKQQAQDILDQITASEANAKTSADKAAVSASSATTTISEGKQAITDLQATAVAAIQTQKNEAVAAVTATQSTATESVTAAQASSVSAVKAQEAASIQAIEADSVLAGYAKKDELISTLSEIAEQISSKQDASTAVTLDGAQTITGAKTFSSTVTVTGDVVSSGVIKGTQFTAVNGGNKNIDFFAYGYPIVTSTLAGGWSLVDGTFPSGGWAQILTNYGDQSCTGTMRAAAFVQTSDERKKAGLTPIHPDLSSLTAYRYTLEADGKTHVGLVAQEVEKVIPEAVVEDKEGFLALDYSAVVTALVDEVNRLRKRVEALEGVGEN